MTRRYTQPRGEPVAVVVAVEPVEEPATVGAAKAHLRVEHSADDTYIGALVKAARTYAERYTRRAFVTQSLDLTADAFPSDGGPIVLPRGRVSSIVSFKYDGADGAEQTLAPASYRLDTSSEPGRVAPAYGSTWPVARAQPGAVRVRYVTGFGLAAAVPADVTHAILMLVADLYERRESEITGTIVSPVETTARRLLDPYRLVRF